MRRRNEVPIGTRFAMLTVERELDPIPRPGGGGTTRLMFCRCDCGLVKEVRYNNLVQGITKSCGCKSGRFQPKAKIA